MTEQEMQNNKVANRTNELEYTFKCKDCGKPTTIKMAEITYCHDSGLRVTERCKESRDAKNRRFKQI